jgi:WD40 repeat protein
MKTLAWTLVPCLVLGGALVARAEDPLPPGAVARLVASPEGGHMKSALFSANGRVLVTVVDKKVKTWDTSTWKETHSFDMKDSDMALAVAPDGKTFAWVAGANARNDSANLAVSIFDAATGEEKLQLPLSKGTAGCPVNNVVYSPDGKKLLACGKRASSGPILWSWDLPRGGQPDVCAFGDEGDTFFTFALSPDGKTVAASTQNSGEVVLIDVSGEKVKEKLRLKVTAGQVVKRVAFSPDGKTFATCGFNRAVAVFETESGKTLTTFPQTFCASVVFLGDGTLVSADKEQFCLWDVPAKRLKGVFGRKGKVTAAEPGNSQSAANGAEAGTSAGPGGKLLAWSVDLEEWGVVYVFDVAALAPN